MASFINCEMQPVAKAWSMSVPFPLKQQTGLEFVPILKTKQSGVIYLYHSTSFLSLHAFCIAQVEFHPDVLANRRDVQITFAQKR